MSQSKCLRCQLPILTDDPVSFDVGRVVYLDCARPRCLSYEERAILFRYCSGHAVATCVACALTFRQQELWRGLVWSPHEPVPALSHRPDRECARPCLQSMGSKPPESLTALGAAARRGPPSGFRTTTKWTYPRPVGTPARRATKV